MFWKNCFQKCLKNGFLAVREPRPVLPVYCLSDCAWGAARHPAPPPKIMNLFYLKSWNRLETCFVYCEVDMVMAWKFKQRHYEVWTSGLISYGNPVTFIFDGTRLQNSYQIKQIKNHVDLINHGLLTKYWSSICT